MEYLQSTVLLVLLGSGRLMMAMYEYDAVHRSVVLESVAVRGADVEARGGGCGRVRIGSSTGGGEF